MKIATTLGLSEMTNKAVLRAHELVEGYAFQLIEFAKKEYFIEMKAELAKARKCYKVEIKIEGSVVLKFDNVFIGNSWGGHSFLIEEIEKELKKQNKR